MLESSVKRYGERTYEFATVIRHQGRLVSFALAVELVDRPTIYYSVLDADGWTATPHLVPFPGEIAQVGFGLADQTPIAPDASTGSNDPFLSTTARLTAARHSTTDATAPPAGIPFHVMSDGDHIFLFRQAIAGTDRYAVTKRHDDGTEVTDEHGDAVTLVDATLLVDRFLLTGDRLTNVREVRFQRSRSKSRPQSRRDGLGDRDLDGNPFVEPTLELSFVHRLRDGRFTVILVPTLVAGLQRWHIVAHNDASGRIDAYSLEQSADGLFNTRGTQFYTSPDPDRRDVVFEARPGTDPLTGDDLVPFVESSGHAESAIDFSGETSITWTPGIDVGAEFTVESWVFVRRPSGPDATEPQRLFGEGRTIRGARQTNDSPPSAWIEDMNRLRIGFGATGEWVEYRSRRILAVDEWNHVALTFDGKKLRIYVGGDLRELIEYVDLYRSGSLAVDADGAPTATVLDGRSPGAPITTLGAADSGFQGVVDEVRIWARALGRRELAAQSTRRLVGNEIGLVAYWRFDEARGTTVFDQTDRRADGSVANGTWVTSDAPVGIGTGLTRNSFTIGSEDASDRTQMHTVESGLSAILYHQQADVASGYDGNDKKLKQSARVMIVVATKSQGADRNEIASIDVGVSNTGRLAELPDLLELRRIESGPATESVNQRLDTLADLERERQDVERRLDAVRADQADLRAVTDTIEALWREPGGTTAPIRHDEYTYLDAVIRDTRTAWRSLGTGRRNFGIDDAAVAAARATFYFHANGGGETLLLAVGRHTDLGTFSAQISGFSVPLELEITCWDGSGESWSFRGENLWIGPLGLNDRFTAIEVAPNTLIRTLTAAQTEVADRLAELAASESMLATRLTTIRSAITATTGSLQNGTELPMPLVGIDRSGLTISGAILGFAWTVDTPRLFDSAMGSVAMYFRGAANQLFSSYYSTFTERATYPLIDATARATVLCGASSVEPEMDDIAIEVTAADDDHHCTVVVSTPGIEETWRHVSRAPDAFAATLNGTASIREYVGRGAAVRVDGMVAAVEIPGGIDRPCPAGTTLVVGSSPVITVTAAPAQATRIEVRAPDGPVPLDTLPVYRLPYDYDRHAVTNRVPSDLYNGSMLVDAMPVDSNGPVSDQRVVSGNTRSSKWTAGAPGNTLSFNGSTSLAQQAGGPASGMDSGDDVTIEAWLRPIDVSQRMRVVRHKSQASEYSMGLEPVRPAIRLDGIDDHITLGTGLDPQGDPWTVELWFRADRTDGDHALYDNGRYTTAVRNGFLQIRWGSAWAGGEDFPVSPGRWYHVAVTRDADGRHTVYRNGVAVSTHQGPSSIGAATGRMIVGAAADAVSDHFAGTIAELRIWRTTRTASEIASNLDRGIDSGGRELVGSWRFQRLSRNRAMNSAASRNHGALSGSPTLITVYDVFAGADGRYGRTTAGFEAADWAHVAARVSQSYALQLGPGDASLSAPHDDTLDLTGDMTIEAVVRFDRLTGPRGIVAKGVLGAERPVPYAFGIDATGRLQFTVVDAGGETHSVRADTPLATATTHGVAVTRTRRTETVTIGEGQTRSAHTVAWDEIAFFVAGAPVGAPGIISTNRPVVIATLGLLADPAGSEQGFLDAIGSAVSVHPVAVRGNDEPMEIGHWRQSSGPGIGWPLRSRSFDGDISEVRIAGRALDVVELGERQPSGGGLVAWYPIEERTGTTARDVVGRNHAEFAGQVTWIRDPDPSRGNLRISRDGVEVKVVAMHALNGNEGVAQSTVGALRASAGIRDQYRGEIEELRIWAVPRTDDQLSDNLFRRLVDDAPAGRGPTDEERDLLAYYSFDARIDATIVDKGTRQNDLAITDGEYVLSTAPIGVDAPHVRSALAGVKNAFHGTVGSQPGVAEYADVGYDADGNVIGTFKRCYVSIDDGDWRLTTGFKVGDLTSDWIGQVQFAPQLVGYIEGAPPVPSENLTATGYVRGEFSDYVGGSSVELTEADTVTHRYSASKEAGETFSLETKVGGILGAEAEVGLFLVTKSLDVENVIGFHGGFDMSWNHIAETSTAIGRTTSKAFSMGLRGSVENVGAVAHPAVGRRFVPDNVGMAFVTSETADLFALRLAHNGALVSFQLRPNPDIPPDENIITFPINPRYTKQGTIDGKIGFEPDPNYPQALSYSADSSYFKPREAYALRNRIESDTARRRTRYLGYAAAAIGRSGADAGPALQESLRSPSVADHKRSLVNRYVWTADGGLYAESEETLESRTETLGGSYTFNWRAGAYLDLTFAVFGFGFKLELDVLGGSHLHRTVTKAEESDTSFGLAVDLGGVESDTYLRDADGELVMDRSDPRNPKPRRQPGRVDAYRFMSFYLEPEANHFDEFFNRVVDPIWLEQSSDSAAAALREARQDSKRPPAWRILHRATYISRVLPEFDDDAPSSLDKTLRTLEIDSNYELIRLLEPHVSDNMATEEEFALAVSDAVDTYLPELQPHLAEIKRYLRLYLGAVDAHADDDGIASAARSFDQAPVVDAGQDQTVGLSGDSRAISIEGDVIDDRYDTADAIFVTWAASDPDSVRFDDRHQPVTTAHIDARGRHELTMTAHDGRNESSDIVTIVVNEPPVVDAGPSLEVRPGSGRLLRAELSDDDPAARWIDTRIAADPELSICRLRGRVVDDGLGDPDHGVITTTWSKVSGAGDVEFSPDLRFASFSQSGHYLVRFTAVNGTFTTDAEVVVAVAARVTTGLIALYTFQEGNGETVHDVSGAGDPCHLTITETSAVAWENDSLQLVSAVTLTAHRSDRVTSRIKESGALTVEAWLRPTDSIRDGLAAIVALSTAPDVRNLMLGQSEDDVHVAVRTSATNAWAGDVALSVPRVFTTELRHMAATRDADGTTSFYVDGKHIASRSVPGDLTPWDEAAVLTVGGEPNSTSDTLGFIGHLHLVALYDRSLTADEIDQNQRYGPDTDLPPIVLAGDDRVIDSPTLPAVATLDALIVHDRPTSDSRVTWTVVNGPGDVDVVDPSAPSVTVRFPETGRYVLRVAAEAGGAMTSDEIVCVVNTTPTVGIVAESTVQLPASLGLRGVVIADGSGDPSMTTTASWAMVAGPGRVTFDDPDALATTASFSAHGRYDLRLEIDNGAFIGSADIVVAVFAAPLLTVEPIPVVTAGDDGTADIPLTATIVDPGLGDPAAPVSAEWSLVSGPADVDIEQLPDANATASVTRNGDYVFRLRVDNGQLSTAATSTVTVNQRPTVDAGIARTVELPARVHLDATVGDDGLPHDPGRVSLLWEQTDGPGGVVFSHATADRTAAAFPRPGTYVLAITADDGAARTTDTVVVEVTAPPRVVDGLAAHYLFAGGSGASVPDIAGVEPALDLAIEPTSAVAWSEPGLGSNGAAKIDSTDAQRMVDAMLGAGGGTLEAVVTVAGAPNDTTRASHIIAVYEDRRLHLALAHDGDGFLALARRGSNRYVTVRDVGGERSADRVHVALVFDVARGVMTLLLDGVEVAAQESTGSVLESDGGTFRVSLLDDRSESAFIGTVHEAAIYGRPISAAEVNANHLATLAGHPTGT